MKLMKKRKGFTLAELLIVITVIGVLASMMMVSSNEAVSTSRATDLVANLKALKGAALMHYVDSMDTYNKAEDKREGAEFTMEHVRKYLDVSINELQDNGYVVYEDKVTGRWYVGYLFNPNDTDIIPKLAARAKILGLLKAARSSESFTIPASENEDDAYFASGGDARSLAVAMLVR